MATIAWFDLTASDIGRSRAFYSALLSWEFRAVQGSDQAFEILANGTPVGTLRNAEGPLSAFNGVVYVAVPDARAASDSAVRLGATVVDGFPFDLPSGEGTVSLILDPSGHPIGLFERARPSGNGLTR